MFLRPSIDLSVIGERLDIIGILLRPDNSAVLQSIGKSMKRIKDIRTVIIHLQKGVCDVPSQSSVIRKGVWGSMQTFVFQVLTLFDAVRQLSESQGLAIVSKVRVLIHPYR